MTPIKLLLLYSVFFYSFAFPQKEEKSAHLVLNIRNDKGEIFKGSILLISNQDTMVLKASWNYSFRVDFLPGNYRLILKNKMFDDYVIDSLWIEKNELKELDVIWKHKTIRLPEIRYPSCTRL
jgi:hypothetical protein